MGETLEDGAAGDEPAKDVDRDKPCSSVASKQLDGGTEGSTCGICSVIVQTRGLLDCCNHLFCISCITEWFTVSNLCPLCKSRSRFITPQMFYSDTGRWEKLESEPGFQSRDGRPSVEDSQAVSFPPYFIDEEAVLCLGGDSCLVRAGLLDLDAEGNAAADTSVACDLCDCWYHGGCVSFQPDQTSFICPRCLVSREPDRAGAAAPDMPTVASGLQSTSSTITSLPPENLSLRGDLTIFGSASLAIEDAEEGESHVSISLRRFPDVQPAKPHLSVETQASTYSAEKEIVWSPIREPLPVQSYGSGWPPVWEPSAGAKPKNPILPPNLEPAKKIPFFQEEEWSPTRAPAAKSEPFQDELWTLTRGTSRTRNWSVAGIQPKLTATSASCLEQTTPQRPESRFKMNTTGARQVVTPRPEIPGRPARIDTFGAISSKTATAGEVFRRLHNLNAAQSTAHPPRMVKEEIGIDVDRLQVAVEQLRKGKRKVLQGDERNVDVRDLPEMPRKIARRSERKVDAVAEKVPLSSKYLTRNTKDQISEIRTVEAVNSVGKGRTVDQAILAADNGQMDVDVLASKDERRMAADVVARSEEQEPASDVTADREDEKTVADFTFNVGEEKAVMQIANREGEKAVADLTANIEEEKTLTQVVVEQQISIPQPESLDDFSVKAEPTEKSCQAQPASSDDISAPEKVDVTNPEVGSEVDVMDIVKESRYSINSVSNAPCPSKGVRTRIIMHREQDMKDSLRPSLVERIRQEMRDTAGHGAGEDLGKVEVSDDRFIAAFKAAQARSYEISGDMKSVSSKAQSSGRLWKVLDKKYSANGARDNLIRKLYAGGGRKCWDRDWDIAFWRERDPNQRKVRKEAESTGKDSDVIDTETDPEDTEFFDRLYVADTSLFPRKEDVKPLSVHANHAEGTSAIEPERDGASKTPQRHLDKGSKTAGVKDNRQQCRVGQGVSATTFGADNSCKGVDSLMSNVVKNPKPAAMSAEKDLSGSSKAGKPQGTSSAALETKGENTGASAGSSDVKKDKRLWALEVLARKEGKLSASSSSSKTGGGASKDNPFELLLELPVEMRPLILGDSRRNKIPPAVRQVQLNRLVEQELKRANLAIIGNNCESIEAIARAVAREEELCKSSNSKGVYLNRCVRALANTEYEVKVVGAPTPGDHETAEARVQEPRNPEVDEAVRKALEDTGLMDSPTAEPVDEHDGPSKEDPGVRASAPQKPVQNSSPENVVEVERTDQNIDTKSELSPDDELSGELAKGSSQKRLTTASAVSSNSSGGQPKTGPLTVILTGVAALGHDESQGSVRNLSSKQSAEGHEQNGGPGVRAHPVKAADFAPQVEASYDDADDMYDGLELNLNPVVSSEVIAQLNAEPLPFFQEQESRENREDPRTILDPQVDLKKRAGNGDLSVGDAAACDNTGEDDLKFADIDRRIENIRRNRAVNGSKRLKGRVHGDANRTNGTHVQMQVEIYVNQHLKPLYRSKVITAEQFKWTVTKTAAKVMEHHGDAVNADFLITEGSKVKKLADQYLRAFAHRKS
ncbi:hypothetical protein R1flu_018866 [Riccia fluitans]|uniref:RING-type domain-containing protein n=1 Tax=Riccia fluitans TaxID=41844 RepID=A0ABD1ZH23_9MARC